MPPGYRMAGKTSRWINLHQKVTKVKVLKSYQKKVEQDGLKGAGGMKGYKEGGKKESKGYATGGHEV